MSMNQEPQARTKQVLLIDSSPLFEGFLNEKLSAEQIKVTLTKSDKDAFKRMVSLLPDLIIIDADESLSGALSFLENKIKEPNAGRIPIIISGPTIPKEQVAGLIKLGVVKYFTKPVKFDTFLNTLGKFLHTTMTIDETACMLETHFNGNLIFVEIAQGLNRDKISLLKYRLADMLDHNTFHDPRLILMMTNLDLTFVDGANLELLFDILVDEKRVKRTHIKVLAKNDFIKAFLSGHPMYSGIEIVDNLGDILNNLVDSGVGEDVNEVVSEKILVANDDVRGNVDIRFGSDTGEKLPEEKPFDASNVSVAIIDYDPNSQNALTAAYQSVKAKTVVYANGQSFVHDMPNRKFDLIVMDLYLPDVNGFELLQYLVRQNVAPILVHSMAPSKQFVVQSLQLGAKGFIGKPQNPLNVLKKSLEILNK